MSLKTANANVEESTVNEKNGVDGVNGVNEVDESERSESNLLKIQCEVIEGTTSISEQTKANSGSDTATQNQKANGVNEGNEVNEVNWLVDVCFIGHNLPRMFEALKSCKGNGTITFSPHEIRVMSAEYKDNSEEIENLVSVMAFSLSNHEAHHYRVTEIIQRKINIAALTKHINAKAFKNKVKEPIMLTFQIDSETTEILCVTMMKSGSDDSGEARYKVPCEIVRSSQLEYAHNYHRYCARKMSSSGLRDKINSLWSASHKVCCLQLAGKVIYLDGEGDGREYAKAGELRYTMPVKNVPEDPEANDFTSEGVFDLAKVKSFVRLPGLSKEVIIYVEDEKPLLLEYIIGETTTVNDCEECKAANIIRGTGYVRYILGPHST